MAEDHPFYYIVILECHMHQQVGNFKLHYFTKDLDDWGISQGCRLPRGVLKLHGQISATYEDSVSSLLEIIWILNEPSSIVTLVGASHLY